MPQLSRRAFGLVFAGSALAQENQDTGLTFRSDTREVLLHATVVDRKGAFVTDLPREAFKVFEDGVEQKLRIFRREDVPVSMGLIVDNSGSMRRKRKKVEDSAVALVKASNRQDEIFIVNFNDVAYRDADLTSDVKKLEEGISRIDAKGGTAMRDAITLSMDYVLAKGKKAKKVLLEVEAVAPVAARIDADQLRQVMLNLVRNAQEAFGDKPGRIVLALHRERVRLRNCVADVAVLSVTDNGPGIPAELHPRLFDPFFTTKAAGTGLGLSIVARLVEQHGGEIVFQSVPNAGTRFDVRLPTAGDDRQSPPA